MIVYIIVLYYLYLNSELYIFILFSVIFLY